MRSSQVTIKDIAKLIGVSPSTVSRALKDHPDISPDMKKRINDLAESLHYYPNGLALSLKKSKSYTIGVIIPEVVHHFFSTVLGGIEDLAIDAGYNVMVCQSSEKYDRELLNARSLISHRVDGVLVSVAKTTTQFHHLQELKNHGIPIVFFDRVCESIPTDTVVVDDYIGAYIAVRHLLDIGCRRIAHLAANDNLLIGKYRKQGYLKALDEYNLPEDPELIFHCDTKAMAVDTIREILKLNPLPDAIFAVNDFTAVAAMMELKKAGIQIPKDMAIVGFGNGPLGEVSCPSLTTLEQQGHEIGKEAVRLLLERIAKKDTGFQSRRRVLTPYLIKRESTFK
ncbi:MAG: substrate-binding domain-containing protein [Bacteroidetes bacterium]|jgi:LacI family transcriptional regulator|nr:substrate-binding domain-containing protein [Bacteroidota bacterium]